MPKVLDKDSKTEYISYKQIPEEALFAPTLFKNILLSFYKHNLDIPLLIFGVKGCGKFTTILGLINNVAYIEQPTANTLHLNNFINNGNDNDNGIGNDNGIDNGINNICYMKILDKDYDKILIYENIYYLNIDILSNITEIGVYLKHIYKIGYRRQKRFCE